MVFKFIALAALVACAKAGLIGNPTLTYVAAPEIHAAPVTYAATSVAKAVIAKTIDTEYDPHPQYSYSYDVQDHLTGDSKTQQETRNGDQVQGSYSLLEADGTRRVVHYTADDLNGFNAVVEKHHPAAVAVKTVAPATVVKAVGPYSLPYAAPVIKSYAPTPALAYPTTLYKSYAAQAPLAHSYATQYSRSYSAPVFAKYAAAPALAYSSPGVPYAAIPVAHSPLHTAYAAAHDYVSK